jgi:hypothetical protein
MSMKVRGFVDHFVRRSGQIRKAGLGARQIV